MICLDIFCGGDAIFMRPRKLTNSMSDLSAPKGKGKKGAVDSGIRRLSCLCMLSLAGYCAFVASSVIRFAFLI